MSARSLSLLAFLLCTAAIGQEPKPIRSDATTMLLPARRIELKELLDATARFLQINIAVDDREFAMQPAVELQTAMSLDKKDAEEAVCELVFAQGFVLAPRDPKKGLYDMVSARGARAREIMQMVQQRTPEEVLARPTLKQPVSTILVLPETNAVVAINAMRPFFATIAGNPMLGLTLGATGDEHTLLLTGIQSDVARAINQLREADHKAAAARVAAAPAAGSGSGAGSVEQRLAALEDKVTALTRRIDELIEQLKSRPR